MMGLNVNKQSMVIIKILLLGFWLILSCNGFAAAGAKATQASLDAAVTNLQEQLTQIGSPRFYEIGDRGPAGGIVFFVHTDGQHGLEAAPSDQGIAISWYNGSYTNTEARGDGVGAGEMNTTLIIANQGFDSNSYAAGLCANLVIYKGGVEYGDWYLPSKIELAMMFSNLDAVGGGLDSQRPYWSSSEYNSDFAWSQYSDAGSATPTNKNSTIPNVRAVRAF